MAHALYARSMRGPLVVAWGVRTAASLSCAFVGLLYYLETLIKLLERLIKTALLFAPSAESLRCLSWSMILVTWLRELD